MAKTTSRQAKRQDEQQEAAGRGAQEQAGAPALSLDGETRGKFVLFAIPAGERVDGGPVMRGFIETEAGKISVAGWKKTGRESGAEYLSLKAGNTRPRAADAAEDAPDEWLVGPSYGRLFRETAQEGERVKVKRYFGFVEDSVRVGEDAATHKGVYRTNWQIQVKAKPEVSGDGRTHYVSGSVHPLVARAAAIADEDVPF